MAKIKCPKCKSKLHISCEDDINHINGLRIFNKDVEHVLAAQLDAILEDLSGLLIGHLKEHCDHFKPLMCRIRILGTDEPSAMPWLVILCPESAVKHAESFFQKPLAREFCDQIPGGLQVAYVGRPPRFRSGSWDDVEVGLGPGETDQALLSTMVTLKQMAKTYLATMGGMLVAKDMDGLETIFGLTVGHLLELENTAAARASDMSSMPDGNVLDTADGMIGHLAKVSFSEEARNSDWALIEFSTHGNIEDVVGSQYGEMESFRLGRCSGPVTFRPKLPLSRRSRIANLPARVLLPSGKSCVKVYPITSAANSNLELPEGCSGSWVVTKELRYTNKLPSVNIHGVAVADDMFGDIYMIPLADIMEDIKQALDVSSISLPRDTRQINHLIRRQRFSLPQNAPDLTTTLPGPSGVQIPNPSPPPDLLKSRDKTVWFCSNCGTGPMASWNPTCGDCGHVYCGACEVEEIK